MNKSNIDFMIKDFLKQNYNINQFAKIVFEYKEKGLVNEEIEKVFYEFLCNNAKNNPEDLRNGDLLELLLWYTGENDPKVLFRLFKTVVNLSLVPCYRNFPMGMEKYVISVLNPDKFLDIENERFIMYKLTLIDSKFNEFVELVIDLMMDVDAETKENLIMDWSIFGTRSYLEKFRDPDFILRFFGVIEDETYKLHMETLHNTISNIFLNENQQFEFIERCKTQNSYKENLSKISSVGKKFEKFFYPEPVTSAVLEIILKFSNEKERKPSDVPSSDELRYGRYINSALRCLDTWEKRTEKMSAKMLNSARKRIIIEALKLIYEDDSSEWFSYLEKLIDNELDKKYKDEEGKDAIPYYATESIIMEIPDYEGIDNVELALEAYSKTSSKIAKVERGVYRPFKKFKIQADKVDSEANKVLKILKKMVVGDKHTEIIEGKKYTPITLVTRALGTIVLFKYNKVAAILAVLVGFALDKHTEVKERVKIVADLETELTMLNEKIEDARAAGDNEAKYAMMRTKAEIEKTIKKIKYGIEAGTKSGIVTNDYMRYGEK